MCAGSIAYFSAMDKRVSSLFVNTDLALTLMGGDKPHVLNGSSEHMRLTPVGHLQSISPLYDY